MIVSLSAKEHKLLQTEFNLFSIPISISVSIVPGFTTALCWPNDNSYSFLI